jgi:anti-anti-sigma factor
MDTALALDEAIRNAEASDVARIVVDLSDLDFIDRAGLAVLLRTRTRLRNRGDPLIFIPPEHEQVSRSIALTGTSEMLY